MNPNDPFARTIFDAIPIPVFVVDDDVAIRDLNEAAVHFCGQSREAVYNRRGGDALHCLHSTDVPEGCGRGPVCPSCILRNSVTKCLEGQTTSRKRMNLQVSQDSSLKELQLLITANPMPDGIERLALLMLEDITELTTLRNILPICMKCKKIREDQQYWKSVDAYFHEQTGVDFSHGLCPDCAEQFYPELRKKQV